MKLTSLALNFLLICSVEAVLRGQKKKGRTLKAVETPKKGKNPKKNKKCPKGYTEKNDGKC